MEVSQVQLPLHLLPASLVHARGQISISSYLEPIQDEGTESQPRVQCVHVGHSLPMMELKGCVYPCDPQSKGNHMNRHVNELLSPMISCYSPVYHHGCSQFDRYSTYIENDIRILGIQVKASTIMQQPDENENSP